MRKLWVVLLFVTLAFPFQTARSSAEYLGGTDSLIISSSAPDLLTNWTFSFWVYRTVAGANYVMCKSVYMGVFVANGNTVQAGIYQVVWGIVGGSTALTDDTWYHVVVTRSGNDWTIWLNGTIEGGPSTNATASGAGENFFLMNSPNALTILVGRLAEVAGWDAVLTPGEISALAHGTPPNRIRATKIKYYWPFHLYKLTTSPDTHIWADLGGGGWNASASGVTDLISNHAPMSPPGGAN